MKAHEQYQTLKELWNEFDENHTKFNDKGTKAAASRARKAIGEIKKLITEYRKASVEESKWYGAVAQLGERHTCTVDVASSSLVSSTWRYKMSFLLNMLSDDAKISSKRFIGFSSFIMLIASWIANTFFSFQVKDQIVECFMYITVVGLGVTAAEKFSKK